MLTSPENGKSVNSDVAMLAADPIARPNSDVAGANASSSSSVSTTIGEASFRMLRGRWRSAPGGLVVRMAVRVDRIALGGLGATRQIEPGGDDRPRHDGGGAGRCHGGDRAIEPAKLNALERGRAADPDHQPGGRGETEQVRAEQVFAGRKLVEGELAPSRR